MNQINFQITGNCNMNCKFCGDLVSYQKESSIEDIKKVMKRFTDQGLKKIHITGGEPLLFEGLEEVLKDMKEKGLEISLSTNGLLLPYRKKILPYIDELILPMDGIYSKTFIEIGRERTQLVNTIKNVCMIKNAFPQMNIKVGTVLNMQNTKEVKILAAIISQLPIDEWKIYQFLPRGKGQKNIRELLLDDREFEQISTMLQASPVGEKITPVSIAQQIEKEWVLTPSLYIIKLKDASPRFYGKINELSDNNIREIVEMPLQYTK